MPATQRWKCLPHIRSLIPSPTPIFFLRPLCSLPRACLFLSFLCSSSLCSDFSAPPFLHLTPSLLALPSFLPLPLLTVMSLGWAQSQMKQLSQAPAPPHLHFLQSYWDWKVRLEQGGSVRYPDYRLHSCVHCTIIFNARQTE